jgi:prepilin peptidase CpaA
MSMAMTTSAPAVSARRQALRWAAALVGWPAAAAAWGWAVGRWLPDQPLGTCAAGAVLALLAVCTVTDLARHKIYNWATYTAALWALVLNACFPWGSPDGGAFRPGAVGLLGSLAGAAVIFVVMLIVFRLSGPRGAGDVKLAAALGAWLGLERGLAALIYTYIAAGVFLLCWVLWTEGPVKVATTLGRRLGSLVAPRYVSPPSAEQRLLLQKPVPMAAFFTAGTLAALLGAPFYL